MRNLCLYIVFLFFSSLTAPGCSNKQQKIAKESHVAKLVNYRGGAIYIDTISCKMVMKEMDTVMMKMYTCFLVGFVDSTKLLPAADGGDIEDGKYFQYGIQNDWMGLIGVDSIAPVFFHSKVGLERHRREGVLVFEHEKDVKLDALVYKDSYGNWGIQKLTIPN